MIVIQFHKGGFVTMNPKGYSGSTCHQATRAYSQKFGGKQEVKATDDAQAVQTVKQTQQQKLRG